MKICYIAPAHSVHTTRWLSAFVERGHDVHLITLPGEQAIVEGVTLHSLADGLPKLRFARWMFAARRILRQIRPDVLHGHYLTRYGWLAAASFFRPLVLTAWGTDAYVDPCRSRIGRRLTLWALHRASLVTANSANLRDRVIELGAREERVQLVLWGVDGSVFRHDTDTSALRSRLDLGPGPVILSTRGLLPHYNQKVILHTLPHVLKIVPDTTLVLIYGGYDPAYLVQLNAMAAELGVKRSVRLVGAISHKEMAAFYAMSDVFVSMALSDSAPVSLLEAMACGASPVVCDLPAIREWILHGKNGYTVSPHDEKALADAIVYLLKSPELRRQFAQTNRRIVETRASHSAEMGRVEQFYLSLAGARRGC